MKTNTLTANRTYQQIYDELRKNGTFEVVDNDKQFFTFDFGSFKKAYQATFVDNMCVDVREYPLDYLNYVKYNKNLKFGGF